MLRFIGDMVIGWVIFTDDGKKFANKIVNKTINTAKNNIMKQLPIQNLPIISEILKDNDNDDKSNINNGTKNWCHI